ncbi:MAG: hypothetical protein PHN75_05035 [Syntrophales bacterium]|nr:hypothetical protein [Syntrophales bacterium]
MDVICNVFRFPDQRRWSAIPTTTKGSTNIHSYSLLTILLLIIFIAPDTAMAVRPFITDDARITDKGSFLIETSLRLDSDRAQNLNVLSYGFSDRLEMGFNFMDGVMLKDETNYRPSISGPGFQMKYLFGDGVGIDFPSIAIAAGFTTPNGAGSVNFRSSEWSEYAYLCISKALVDHPENLNMHINLGLNHAEGPGHPTSAAWGIGFQIHMVDKTFLCTEVFAGDPYAITPGAIYQIGIRYFISDKMQFDASTGHGLWGEPALGGFLGFGFRKMF